jgi:hypothetical protein
MITDQAPTGNIAQAPFLWVVMIIGKLVGGVKSSKDWRLHADNNLKPCKRQQYEEKFKPLIIFVVKCRVLKIKL